MVRTHSLILAAVAAMLGGAPARAELGARYERGDLDALRGVGAAGRVDLAHALHAGDRATVLGAILAAEAAPAAWELLGPLAVVAAGWDRSTAAPAARGAARIARALDGDAAILHDLDDDRLEALGARWSALAARADRWTDVRVHALEVATRLARARLATAEAAPDVWGELLAAAGGDDPELARAALELAPLPAPPTMRGPLAAIVSGGAPVAVRLAAAQVLCAALPDDADAVLAALGPAGLDAVRAAVSPPPAGSDGALLDAARCLAADPDPRSRRVLTGLRQAAPRSLRAAIAGVAADVAAGGAGAASP